jgi:transcriptional regulator with XRE-family HTH domain
MAALNELERPRSPQELFGRRLRKLRERRELTQQGLGKLVPISQGRIAQFENGKELPTEDVAKRLDDILEADGELSDIWEFAGQLHYAAVTRTYSEAESKAVRICHFANMMPGLAQVEDYARVIVSEWNSLIGGLDVEATLKDRRERQSILDSANPPWLWSVLDEVALRRIVGSPTIMRTQLLHLLELGTRPRVTFQVLPYGQQIPGGFTSTVLSLLTLPDGHQLAYQESGLNTSFAKSFAEVSTYAAFYDHLQARALPPADSADLIRAIIEEHYSDPTSA